MFGFALGCAFCGLVIGLSAPSVLLLAITSLQIVALLLGLWFSEVLNGVDVLIWGLSGLFLHQGSYLAGFIALAIRQDRRMPVAQTLAEQVDGDLVAMDGLVGRLEQAAPAAQVDTVELKQLIRQMRRTLRDDEALERLRRERRRAAG